MKKLLVVYHKLSESLMCTDGFAAAFAFWLKYGDDAEYTPAFYHQRIPLSEFAGRDVVFVDFAYPADYMDQVYKVARTLLVLDHHKTTMLELGTRPYVKLDMGKCGAQLAWEHVFPDQDTPKLFQHIKDHDLWLFDSPNTKAFIQKLRSVPSTFEQWEMLYEKLDEPTFYRNFIYEGEVLLEAHRSRCAVLADSAFPIVLGGIKGLAVNANKFYAHDVGELLAQQSGTFGATFYFRPDNYVEFSLSSVGDFDVEKIAFRYNGGGLKNASGFSMAITSFSSIVDLSSKNVSFYLSLHSHIEEFCESFKPETTRAVPMSTELANKMAAFLLTRLGSVAEELEVNVEVFNVDEKSIRAKFMYQIARLLKLPFSDKTPKWYHRVFPYKVNHIVSFDDAQISELLELSKSNDTLETQNFVVANLMQTVKISYEAYLRHDAFSADITVRFPNSSFFLKHSVDL